MSCKAIPRAFRPARLPFAPACRALQQRRSFINLPGTEPQSFSATRILPYPSKSLYTIIADIESYSSFVPYCLESRVTKSSHPDSDGRAWPSSADLKVGFGSYSEVFTSRVYCVPNTIVEALAGDAETSIPKDKLQHHSDHFEAPRVPNDIFKSLKTRWELRPFHYKPPTGQPQSDMTVHPPRDQTEVSLSLEFEFSNPLYAMAAKAAAPKVAGIMIEAFEDRAREVIDGPGAKKVGGKIGGKIGGNMGF